MNQRFAPAHIDTWRREGCVVLERFFTPDEVAAVQADFVTVFGREEGASDPLVKKKPGSTGRFHDSQFTGIQAVPCECSPALNLIGAHPALVAFAQAARG